MLNPCNRVHDNAVPRHRSRWVLIALFVTGLVLPGVNLFSATKQVERFMFIPLDVQYDDAGVEPYSIATSVSDDGTRIGGIVAGQDGLLPSIWIEDVQTELDLPAGYQGAYVNAISGDGLSAVALSLAPEGFRGVRWDVVGKPHILDTQAGTHSSFNGINYDGTVACGFVNEDFFGSDAVVWTSDGGTVNVGDVPGLSSRASLIRVTNDGMLFVGYGSTDRQVPVTWSEADGFEILDGTDEDTGGGRAINVAADGSVIVGALELEGGNSRPAYWDDNRVAYLIDLWPGYEVGEALAASDGGIIVGAWRETPFSAEDQSLAFIWDSEQGVRPLQQMLADDHGVDLQGWTLNEVRDITPDGDTMVGVGTNPDGFLEAWKVVRVVLPDEVFSDRFE